MDNRLVELKRNLQLLNAVFHRNKNQHRRAKWWRWLGMLKRAVAKVIDDHEHHRDSQVVLRLEFLQLKLTSGCYLAFREVLGDNQFASIGVVLLGILSSLEKLSLAILQKLKPLAPRASEERNAKNENPRNQLVSDSHDSGKTIQIKQQPRTVNVSKKAESLSEPGPATTYRKQIDGSAKSLASRSKARKRKDANILDDLFEGLV